MSYVLQLFNGKYEVVNVDELEGKEVGLFVAIGDKSELELRAERLNKKNDGNVV